MTVMETFKPKNEQTRPDTDNEATTKKFWDERAERAGSWRAEGQPHSFFTTFLNQHRQELGKEAIDIGCGRGIYVVPLAEQGFHVHGVDISQNMLKLTKGEVVKRDLNSVDLVNASTRQLPFSDQSMDFAISFGVLYFNDWTGINESFDEVNRVLRPGQYFMMQVRSANNTERERTKIEDTPGGFISVSPDDPHGVRIHYFSRDGLITLGNQHGFDIVQGPIEDGAQDADRASRRRWWVVFKKKLQE